MLREVALKSKPIAMLKASPKGTVPVLVQTNGSVLEESLDIMQWSLNQSDGDNWLGQAPLNEQMTLVTKNDGSFKHWLDKYKYASRFPEESAEKYRDNCVPFLQLLESALQTNNYLFGEEISLADVAIFPFIRQFSGVESEWLGASSYTKLNGWLTRFCESPLFLQVMQKYPVWTAEDDNSAVF